MRRIIEPDYGADADNRRGITLTSYELDDDDFDSVVEELNDLLNDRDFLYDTEIVRIYNPYTEEVDEFEVNPSDYL